MTVIDLIKDKLCVPIGEVLARLVVRWYSQAKRTQNLSEECPSLELLAAFVEHHLLPEQKRCVEDHLVDCRRCRKLVTMIVKTQKAVPDPIPPDLHYS